jgi:hypothetical protein
VVVRATAARDVLCHFGMAKPKSNNRLAPSYQQACAQMQAAFRDGDVPECPALDAGFSRSGSRGALLPGENGPHA